MHTIFRSLNRRRLLSGLAAGMICILAVGAARAQTHVVDEASMFSEKARAEANALLAKVQAERGWNVVVQTIPSLARQNPTELAIANARKWNINGVYVLLAQKEHGIQIEVNRKAHGAFGDEFRQRLKNGISRDFKAGEFDAGLVGAAKYISATALAAPVLSRQPAGQRGAGAPIPMARGEQGGGSIVRLALITVAIVVGVMLIVRLLGAMMGGGASAGAPGAGMAGPGMGGGGFFSGMLGGLGGAMLGNWLYDSFSGRRSQAGETFYNQDPGSFDSTSGGPDQFDSTSGTWDDTSGGGGDWGGGGGDFGGGDFGGGGGDW